MSALPKPWGLTDRPPGLQDPGYSRLVRGQTMGGIVHGSLVFYDNEETPPSLEMVGELVCAGVVDFPEPYIRFLDLGSCPGLYTLRSVTGDPIRDVQVEWAAPIKWVRLPALSLKHFVTRVEV